MNKNLPVRVTETSRVGVNASNKNSSAHQNPVNEGHI